MGEILRRQLGRQRLRGSRLPKTSRKRVVLVNLFAPKAGEFCLRGDCAYSTVSTVWSVGWEDDGGQSDE
jgi:hypothetical protein